MAGGPTNSISLVNKLNPSKNTNIYKTLDKAAQQETIIFRVVIRNIANTYPKISTREYYQVKINQDTTLNFTIGEATNYNMNLYVGNWGYDQVFVLDTDSDTIVDTLTGFVSVSDIIATRSGKKLYVTTSQYSVYPYDTTYPASVYSVDLQTKLKKQILEKSSSIYLEPDGVPLIFAWQGNDSLKQVGMIDTVSDEIAFFDTLDIINAGYEGLVFDPQKNIFYSWTNRYYFFAYNYKDKEITQNYSFVNTPSRMVISPDGKQIYFANGPVLDVIRDSLVGSVPANNLASLSLSPDGQSLYITDPGKYIIPEPVPSGKIEVFLTRTNSYIDSIDVNMASGQAHTITDRMIIMPDGKKAYVTDSISNIFVLDLETNEVVNVIRFVPHNIQIRPLYLGTK
jgi:DNA-binding beta-propeller fold protein YncE